MKQIFIMAFVIIYSTLTTIASTKDTIKVNNNLHIIKLTDKIYLYTAWDMIEGWGRVGSNGLIVHDSREAFIIDTPTSESQTDTLCSWIETTLTARVVGFAPGHWHSDCVGGMGYLKKHGVETYAHKMTNRILSSKNRPTAQHSFTDSTTLKVGKVELQLKHLGGGHALDNIVVWIPVEKVLFGGCMLKDCQTYSMGNTEDAAPIKEWLATVEAIDKQFLDAKIVVPGHGPSGGREVILHTKEVLHTAIDSPSK